jgi:tRNA modification GTPase
MVKAFSSELSSALVAGADTIVARATPAGRGALAVIRVSGPLTTELARRVCSDLSFADGWRAQLTGIRDARGNAVEQAVAVSYPAPRSYTGEDMLEVTVHGSPYLVETVLEAFVAGGARPAAPGDFTRRAVANGKMDLVQAEAVRDLVDADTAWQLRNAREQMAGRLSKEFAALRAGLLSLLAVIEAAVDYEAQGIVVPSADIAALCHDCHRQLARLTATAGAGARIRDGLRVAILGPPNAGKSTLFNCLCGSERAIVSPRPGTTLDLVEAELEVGGVRVILQDTAGLRTGGGEVEAEGHRRAVAAAASADLVVMLRSMDDPDGVDLDGVPESVPVIRVRSKADLDGGFTTDDWLQVSCRTGAGLPALRAQLTARAVGDVADLGGAVAIGARHRHALETAARELDGCDPARPELAAEAVRWALRAVDGLIGDIGAEDVLDRIFSTFCVGK